MFPEDEQGFGIDDQFYVGDSGLLVKPVTVEGATTTEVYISDSQVGHSHRSSSRTLTYSCRRTTTISPTTSTPHPHPDHSFTTHPSPRSRSSFKAVRYFPFASVSAGLLR